MARVRSNFFGISGKLGDKVYKIMNGKTYVARLPEKFTLPMDAASVERRKKFSLCVKLAHSINKIPAFHYVWKKYLRTTNVPGKIIKEIYSRITPDDISNLNLTPRINFLCNVKSLVFTPGKITIVFLPLGQKTEIWEPAEGQIALHGVLTLINKDADVKLRHLCIPLSSEYQKTDLVNEMTFELMLPALVEDRLADYPFIALHTALATIDLDGNAVKVSIQCYNEISNPEFH
ncbi:MAG: hypothetical protein ACM3RX_05745 [Methanococcaceae archaeon]